MGIKIVEGRNFSKEMASDSEAAIINKTMAKELGLKNPIGQKIENGWEKFTVIGVVEDFNFESMKQNIGAFMYDFGQQPASIVSVKMNACKVQRPASIHYFGMEKFCTESTNSLHISWMKALPICMQMYKE